MWLVSGSLPETADIMPSPAQLKDYVTNSFYHLYNRGVGKMAIFRKEEDYVVFLHYLRIIFSPVEVLEEEFSRLRIKSGNQWDPKVPQAMRLRRAINQAYRLELYKQVELLSFNLMPNHLHLLIYQKIEDGIEKLMRRLASGYSSYFTKEYDHAGTIYEDTYKGSHLYYEPELQALITARYIERNTLQIKDFGKTSRSLPKFQGIEEYPFSSLRYYIAEEKGTGKAPMWLNTKRLQKIFAKIKARPNGILEERVARHKSYTDFVLSGDDFTPEDVRLGYLAGLF